MSSVVNTLIYKMRKMRFVCLRVLHISEEVHGCAEGGQCGRKTC